MPDSTGTAEAGAVAQDVMRVFGGPFRLAGHGPFVRGSIGMAPSPHDADTVTDLFSLETPQQVALLTRPGVHRIQG